MGSRKIVDEGEVVRWFEEGRTYSWMQAEYRRKYNIETVQSMWGNFRRRRGLERRIVRDDELIPWAVEKRHRWAYPLMMLRAEGRRRGGLENSTSMEQRLDRWLRKMERERLVVGYDPESEEGFRYLPRGLGDADLIRAVPRKTTERRAAHDG